jgi:hypothetical protein
MSDPASPELLGLTDRRLRLCIFEVHYVLEESEGGLDKTFCSNLEEMRLLRLPDEEKVFDSFLNSRKSGDGDFEMMRRDRFLVLDEENEEIVVEEDT